MQRPRTFTAANLTIICDNRCPIYYCDDPCRVQRHAETYTQLIASGLSCAQFSGGE